MFDLTHSAFALQATRVFRDTVVTIQVPPELGFIDRLGTIASAILALAVLLIAIGLLMASWQLKAVYNRLNALLDRLSDEATPVLQNAAVVADDVRDITGLVKQNLRDVEETVATANEQIRNAARGVGARIERFNALLDTVQDEAESAFVATASAVRGVRTGIETAFHRMPDPDEPDEEDEDDDEGTEYHRGQPPNRHSRGETQRETRGPRVRPRPAGQDRDPR